MDELASFNTTLSHRHYGEGAYAHRKQYSSLTDLRIITYGAATGLKSLFRYVNQEYLSRASGSPAKILLGLAGVAEFNDTQADEITKVIVAIADQLSSATEFYLHAACHIKLLSHDSVAYLGSQNVSNGAEPYFEGANSSKKYFNRFHEVILKVEDTDLAWIDTLLEKVISDHQLCIRITREHRNLRVAQELVRDFVHNSKLERIIENITTGNLLEEFLTKKKTLMEIELNDTSSAELCKLVNAITQEQHPEVYLIQLKELLLPDTDFSWFKLESALSELKNIISKLGDNFPGKIELQCKLDDEQPLILADESDDRLIYSIQKVAHAHDLESLDEYIENQKNNIIHSIIQSPDYSQDYMYGAIDNDGNVNEELLNNRFSAKDTERDEDENGNFYSYKRYAMSLDEKLDQVDVTALRLDLKAVFSKEINKLWADDVLKLVGALSKQIMQLYKRELDSKDFSKFFSLAGTGQPGKWSPKWTG
ncbi:MULTISPECIES: hypothetical protein [Pseudomonas]|nr:MULTISPECIES: hypothetical protein [Pseudomonas]POD69657.1 hypothetical protein BKM07_09835 [Pseudomonas syringae group genomosp. 3]WIN09693.1 hypothetical protein QQF68_12925 [Pseudomonas syringae pv. antirrhini str. 126]